ncbi:universal stress protein [Streptomyces neyagawaensis]|uniref:universal stress protein n=1 Tax=Streptomyces neyagawaensis TaxID=42238 RepID=UPI0006E2C62D|nr:universal stress protein [Streptomyces neyagawaensis]MCL6735986.1 universal stress protein [Streptomyces neyagawaensis]MDE1686904.1 universal stress protein [Streptomyces neyagawaensis]
MIGSVTVGFNGTPAGMTTVWWAAREAAARRLPIVLVHSWTTQPLDVPALPQEARSKRQYGRDALRRAEAEVLHRYGDLELSTELVSAPAADELVDRSADAALLVVGSRGHGSLASFLLGSISLHVLGQSRCPAVTVRAGDPSADDSPGGPAVASQDAVVVGVQEPGPSADALLDFAFTEAASRGTPVHVVRVLPLLAALAAHPHGKLVTEPVGPFEAEERVRLTAALKPWRETFPDTPVEEQVTTGHPSQALLTAAVAGRLLVVGRPRHRPGPWRLGPVAHAALHHVPCPVAIVPHD